MSVLNAEERAEVEPHLRDQCPKCMANLRRAHAFNAPVARIGVAMGFESGPVDLSTAAALAITDEPGSGSPAPTTTPFLVTPVQGL